MDEIKRFNSTDTNRWFYILLGYQLWWYWTLCDSHDSTLITYWLIKVHIAVQKVIRGNIFFDMLIEICSRWPSVKFNQRSLRFLITLYSTHRPIACQSTLGTTRHLILSTDIYCRWIAIYFICQTVKYWSKVQYVQPWDGMSSKIKACHWRISLKSQ